MEGELPPVPAKWKAKRLWRRSTSAIYGLCVNCAEPLDAKALVLPKDKFYLLCRPCKGERAQQIAEALKLLKECNGGYTEDDFPLNAKPVPDDPAPESSPPPNETGLASPKSVHNRGW